MIRTFPQAEQALRDMLVHKAQGRAHDAVARLVGMPRPRGFLETDWVNAIHVLAFGARGHPRAVFRFLEMALMRWHRPREVEVDDSNPLKLYKGNGAAFDDSYLGRLVRLGTPVYDDFDDALNPGVTGALYAVAGTRHAGGNWVDLVPIGASDSAAPAAWSGTQFRHARFLCFRIREAQSGPQLNPYHDLSVREQKIGAYVGAPCLYEVLLDPLIFPSAPPTYLQDASATGRRATSIDDPGDRVVFADGHAFVADQVVRAHTFTTFPGGLAAGIDYYVVNPNATSVQLSLTQGGSAIVLTAAVGHSVSLTPKTTVPFGGHLPADATVDASRTRDSAPKAIYLSNGRRLAQLETVLEEVLAAGVRIEIKLDRL